LLQEKAIASGQKLFARLVSGTGNGAQFRAGNAVSKNASSRTCVFTITSGGARYEATDVIYLAVAVNNTWVRMTGNFAVGSVLTRGVDNERELVQDFYRIAKIRDWSYNSTSEVIETTALGDVTKTFAPSITSGEGSATLMFYEDDLNDSDTQSHERHLRTSGSVVSARCCPTCDHELGRGWWILHCRRRRSLQD
jgi:hypothetical protein